MELLLLVHNNNNAAIDMRHVSRIVNLKNTQIGKEWILPGDKHAVHGVLLKNEFILPVERIVEMMEYEEGIIMPNPFLKGCMTKKDFCGFAVVQNTIYVVLSPQYLKMAGIPKK